MSYDYDLFVIGGGSGGVATARRAAEYGAKVGLAEFDRLGGTCVNRGCIPKKLMVYTSHFPGWFQDAQGYGWSEVNSTLDWKKMVGAVNQELQRLNGIYQRMLAKSTVEVIRGYAKFLDPHTLEIGDGKVTAEKILIAVGGYPTKPNITGIEHAITSDSMFTLDAQPKRVAIIGGGYIGVEFACILHHLGSEVTQIIRSDKVLRGFDEDIRVSLHEAMVEKGMKILANSTTQEIRKTQEGLQLLGLPEEVTVDVVLTATGRKPRLENLGLENTGVELSNGAIAVDKYDRTTEEHIYAVGDCITHGEWDLTPVAIREGRAFADTVFGGKSKELSYENIPTAIFSTPEVATVGLSEAQAKEKYGEEGVKTFRARFKSTYYSLAGRNQKTMMKLVVNSETDQVLGAHMVGDHGAEIIQGIAIAIKMGATKADFDATVALHPSVAEEFVTMR